jgi:hypothetical protein
MLNLPQRRQLSRLLIAALVFAAAHIALHEQDIAPDGLAQNDACEVCRLNHVPIILTDIPTLSEPQPYYVRLQPRSWVATFEAPLRSLGARGPPSVYS